MRVKCFWSMKATILDPQVLTDGELKPKLSHFVTSLLHSTSVCNTFDRELSENKEGGETDGPGSFETGHSQGNLSFIAIVLPDCTAVRNVLKGRRFQKMIGRRILCGGKEGQKVAIDFCIHSDVALKKVLRIFSREGGLDAALEKILEEQNNPKYYDDLNRSMHSGGQKLCANEMQHLLQIITRRFPKKNASLFHDFMVAGT